jgi:hypothetical protein
MYLNRRPPTSINKTVQFSFPLFSRVQGRLRMLILFFLHALPVRLRIRAVTSYQAAVRVFSFSSSLAPPNIYFPRTRRRAAQACYTLPLRPPLSWLRSSLSSSKFSQISATIIINPEDERRAMVLPTCIMIQDYNPYFMGRALALSVGWPWG